jgi:hypothetical protein
MAISPYVIEVVSALERALAMAYTGDARVIVKDLMVPLGLKQSLLELGLPSITRLIKFDLDPTQSLAHNRRDWPLTQRQEPAVASMRAQTLTYGKDHYLVSVLQSHFHWPLEPATRDDRLAPNDAHRSALDTGRYTHAER